MAHPNGFTGDRAQTQDHGVILQKPTRCGFFSVNKK